MITCHCIHYTYLYHLLWLYLWQWYKFIQLTVTYLFWYGKLKESMIDVVTGVMLVVNKILICLKFTVCCEKLWCQSDNDISCLKFCLTFTVHCEIYDVKMETCRMCCLFSREDQPKYMYARVLVSLVICFPIRRKIRRFFVHTRTRCICETLCLR